MYVRNRMTEKPHTLAPEANALEALGLMRDKKIKRIPVLKNGKIVGIITERKLLEITPPITSLNKLDVNILLQKTKIESIMTKDVITVTPATLIEEAALKMREYDIGGMPVVDEGKLVGIITETDIFDAFLEIMGLKDQGSRISIEVIDNKPGVLAHIAGIIASNGLNITHLAVYNNEIIIRLDTIKLHDLLEDLRKNGYKIISIVKDE